MFNKSQIMKRAWEIIRETYTIAGYFHRPASYPEALAYALKRAWQEAKAAARAAEITVTDRQAQIAALQGRIETLSYRPLGHNIQRERKVLQNELQALAA